MTDKQRKAVDDARRYILFADVALADLRRASLDMDKFKGDIAFAQRGLDQAWTAVSAIAKAVEEAADE